MKSEPKPWTVGDPCPSCGSDLRPVPAASDAMRAKAAHRDANSWVPIPPTHDSAEPDFIAEHGDLYRCPVDGYQSRATAPAEAAHKSPEGAAAAFPPTTVGRDPVLPVVVGQAGGPGDPPARADGTTGE